MKIVLFEPEIPPNTGNIARLCASTGIHLNLIEPLGFKLEDRYLKRAGLDYWPHVRMDVWPDWDSWLAAATAENGGTPPRCVLTSARGGEPLQHFAFAPDDCLVFGPETRGLPPEILKTDLKELYPDYQRAAADCRFNNCIHINEPDCEVKALVEEGVLDEARYQNYKKMVLELEERERMRR